MSIVGNVEKRRDSLDSPKSSGSQQSEHFVGLSDLLADIKGGGCDLNATHFHKEFPLELLPWEIQRVVTAMEEVVNCPVELAVQAALSAISVSVGAFHQTERFQTGGLQPITLAQVGSAISGDRKSTVDSAALGGIREAVRELNYLARTNSDQPKIIHWSTQDMTVEGACDAYNTSPVLSINSTDGASFLFSHSMSAEKKSQSIASFTQWWDGIGTTVIRAKGNKDVQNPRLDISLMLQPHFFQQFMSDELFLAQGFAARFLLHPSKSRQGSRFIDKTADFSASRKIIDEFRKKTAMFFKEGIHQFEEGKDRFVIKISEVANERLIEFYDEVERIMAPNQPLHGDPYAQRVIEHAIRLSALFVAFDKRNIVEERDVLTGIGLARHYLVVWYGVKWFATESGKAASARELLTKLLHRFEGEELINVRRVQQAFNLNRSVLDPLLDVLDDMGAIRFMEFNNKRKPKSFRFGDFGLIS
jgi:hypothetical protein